MSTDRRQFERFPLAEEVIAFDEQGQRLGRVVVAGGGGMAIQLDSVSLSHEPGGQFRVRLVERESGIEHVLEVKLLYVHQGAVGVQFVRGQESS